jgi:hypothetical protein
VFEIVKTADGYASTPTVLYSFCARPNCADGNLPNALIADANGNLFGSAGRSDGPVFEIVKTADGYASNLINLAAFCTQPNCADGDGPGVRLIDANGNLFGITQSGGAHNQGTVFEIVKTADGYASTPALLYSFCPLPNCADGRTPTDLIVDANGNLFGITQSGGSSNGGTVFEIAKTVDGYASTPTVLFSFCSPRLPNCDFFPDGLIVDANGNLFGTTAAGAGTVFEIAKTADGYARTATTLVEFCSLPNCADGFGPGGLIADAKGNLFGTTGFGGNASPFPPGELPPGAGTVFEIVKTAEGYESTPTLLYSFCAVANNCTDGFGPGGLIADANGNLFGTTAYGVGTVFELTDTGFVVPVALPPSEVATTGSGLVYSRVSQTFNGTVTITNVTSNPISGPFSLLFTRLTAGVTLANAQGTYSGSPFLTVPGLENLAAGKSATVGVELQNPSLGVMDFTPVLYSGSL